MQTTFMHMIISSLFWLKNNNSLKLTERDNFEQQNVTEIKA